MKDVVRANVKESVKSKLGFLTNTVLTNTNDNSTGSLNFCYFFIKF